MRYKVFIFSALVVALLLGSLLFTGHVFHAAQADGQLVPQDVGNLPPLLQKSRLIGADQTNRALQLSIGLRVRNAGELNSLLSELYDPHSPRYHHYLSVTEFAQHFAPTATQQQAVIDYLRHQGFTVTQTFAHRLLIDFSGPESLAERVFGVTINTYRTPGGRVFYANANLPKLPAYLASSVDYIGGLDNAVRFTHPPVISKNRPHLGGGAKTACPSGSASSITPSQFAKAYDYNTLYDFGLQGQGQTVGVFELDGYSQSDIQTYASCFGGGGVKLQNVILDGFNGQPGAGAVEVELDIEAIIGMAPKLAKVMVYEAPNTTQGYNDEFARIVQDKTPVTSVSWGDCESNMGQQEQNQENKFFQAAAAQGQSFLVASGDSGSETCFQQNYDFSLVADDPAVQPYVTAVGGTTLTLKSDNSYGSEHVWNSGLLGGAGGGGISKYFKMPSWQKGPGVQNSYSNGNRETPDVSLDADPATGYPIYCTVGSNCTGAGGSGWLTIGGTSAAAPMWAALVAIANQKAVLQGKGPLGFLNPLLYGIGSNPYSSKTDFHDITQPGNNDLLGINGGAYPVTTGYDMATGWGSFDATRLAADLVAQA